MAKLQLSIARTHKFIIDFQDNVMMESVSSVSFEDDKNIFNIDFYIFEGLISAIDNNQVINELYINMLTEEGTPLAIFKLTGVKQEKFDMPDLSYSDTEISILKVEYSYESKKMMDGKEYLSTLEAPFSAF